MSTWNPNAFSNSGGTYLSSLYRRTHSFSSGELRYSPGEMFNSFTICSNEFGNATGRIDPGFVKLRFTERRIMHLSMPDLSTSPGPEDQPNLKMPAQVIFFEPPTRSSQQVIFAWYRGFGRRYGVNLGNPWVCTASVGGGGAETDGVKTCSELHHRSLSGFGHRSFVDR